MRQEESLDLLKQENIILKRRAFLSLTSEKSKNEAEYIEKNLNDSVSAASIDSTIIELSNENNIFKEKVKELKMQLEEYSKIKNDFEAERTINRWIKEFCEVENFPFSRLSYIEKYIKNYAKELESAYLVIKDHKNEINALLREKNSVFNDFSLVLTKDNEDFLKRLKAISEENIRLREERDKMRQLYEEANLRLNNSLKQTQQLQESFLLNSSLCDIANSSIANHKAVIEKYENDSENMLRICEEQILQELEEYSKAVERLEQNNNDLLRLVAEKDDTISKALNDVFFL